jgi:serpin B
MLGMLLFFGASSSPDLSFEIPEVSKQINTFTFAMLREDAARANAPANTILSPQSIFHGLAMSYVASGGETRKELANVLHFPENNKQLLEELGALRRQLLAAGKTRRIEVSVANSLWLDKTYADFSNDYVRRVQAAFNASLKRVKFAQKEQASKEINNWVSAKTHGKIQNSVGPEDFASRSVPGVIDEPALVAINAVYFKADWASRFDKSSTRRLPFQVDAARTAETMMMHQRSPLLYTEDDRFQFLELPYVGAGYSMYVILPREVIAVRSLAAGITPELVADLKRKASVREGDALIPKLEINSHLGLKNVLSEMGVRSAFDNRKADFDQMLIKHPEAYRLYLSEIYHAAWIDVHEAGTEAAAATTTTHFSIGCSAPHRPPPATFHADHPFLFLIVHNQSRSILFAGWISEPEALVRP